MLWDGFSSGGSARVIVIGATNRPEDGLHLHLKFMIPHVLPLLTIVDPAIVRRMPRSCHIDLPDENQRLSILKVHLKSEKVRLLVLV
jgi:SpoVK/Ycf46/Vps4 family AAA+-type ATPase